LASQDNSAPPVTESATSPGAAESGDPAGVGSMRRSVPDWLDTAAQYAWRWLLVGGAVGGALWLVARLRLILVPCVAALIMATVLVPPFRFLRAKGFPRLPAALVVFFVPALLLAFLAWTAGPALVSQFDELGPALAQAIERAQDWISERLPDLQSESARLEARLRDQLTRNSSEIFSGLIAGASIAIEAIAGTLLTLTLLFFFIKDGDLLANAIVRPLPPNLSRQLRTVGPIVWSTLTAYVRGVVIIGAVNGVAVGLALLILDVPLVIPLMVLTFLGAFFPLVGAVLAGVAAVLVALVSQGVTAALILAVVVLVVQQLEGDLVAPLVYAKAVNLHPVAVLAALTIGAVVAGVIGAVLAVPVAASVASSFTALRRSRIEVEGGESISR
jgi:putative heme transporter